MAGDAPTADSKAAQVTARKLSLTEKERKQREFIDNCTIADVLVDAANPKTDTTILQSIKYALIYWELIPFVNL
jgi:hypothetical protein